MNDDVRLVWVLGLGPLLSKPDGGSVASCGLFNLSVPQLPCPSNRSYGAPHEHAMWTMQSDYASAWLSPRVDDSIHTQ